MSTPAAPPAPREESGGNVLQQRLGPFATWVWLLFGTVLILGYAYYRNRKAAASGTSTTGQATAGQSVAAQQVPDIIIQNQEGNETEATPPPPGSVPPGPPAPTPPPSGGGGTTGQPIPAGPPKPVKPPVKPPAKKPQYKIITVARYNDDNPPWNSTLSGIATHLGVKGGWQELAKLNGIRNPKLIRPGQKIRVPA